MYKNIRSDRNAVRIAILANLMLVTITYADAVTSYPHIDSQLLQADPNAQKLYSNLDACPNGVKAIAVGGRTTINGPSLQVLDWFQTTGGQLSAVEFYAVNGSPGAIPTHLSTRYHSGANATNLGTEIFGTLFRTHAQSFGAPPLSMLPVHVDAETGEARLMKIRIDYETKRYTIVDAETGEYLIDTNGEGQDIGTRPIPILPPGPVGIRIRFASQFNICGGGNPTAGIVLAGGGTGNEDGLHIVNADDSNCAQELDELCDLPGWDPSDGFGNGEPCPGRSVCWQQRPHYGLALTLYGSPSNEDPDGNNEIATSDEIVAPAPDSGNRVTIAGYLGDNDRPSGFGPLAPAFDEDADGDIDLLDFGVFQSCFNDDLQPGCFRHDANFDGLVDIVDFGGEIDAEPNFFDCATGDISAPNFTAPGVECQTAVLSDPDILKDVDIYRITNLTQGNVLSILVQAQKTATGQSLWNPYLHIYTNKGFLNIPLAFSDDFLPGSSDAFTTIEIPDSTTEIFAIVSNRDQAIFGFDLQTPTTIPPISSFDEGGDYTLTIATTDPQSVQDDESGGPLDCYLTKHEPDDTLDDADARGAAPSFNIRGAIGDGAFAPIGQDVDIYRIDLTGDLAIAKSLTARIAVSASGYQAVIDLALALYDSNGILIACADQSSTFPKTEDTRSLPQLAANVSGEGPDGDGVYYLAVFGTNRTLFVFDPQHEHYHPVSPATPPTILSFPHDSGLTGTETSDNRPLVGGRANIPMNRLQGRTPPSDGPPASSTIQCYRLIISPQMTSIPSVGMSDESELVTPDGNDAIPLATPLTTPSDRPATASVIQGVLGNGPYGGWQGDVDFYEIDAQPGQLLTAFIADNEQPPATEHGIRSYMAVYDGEGRILETQAYSLEAPYDHPGLVDDGIANELAANIAVSLPESLDGPVYLMVGIDAGNLEAGENTPYDPNRPGTTLVRRFGADIWAPRTYNLAVSLIDPVLPSPDPPRLFVVPIHGVDDDHTVTWLEDLEQSTSERFPPIMEIDPVTGDTIRVLPGYPFLFTTRGWSVTLDGFDQFTPSSNPSIAYDGQTLFVTTEQCMANCLELTHPLFAINPDVPRSDPGYLQVVSNDIDGFESNATVRGMTEIDGYLYALDDTNETLRYWDKTLPPFETNGGTLSIVPAEGFFNDVYGDIGSSNGSIYVACSLDGIPAGICVFTPDPGGILDGETGALEFTGLLYDPVSNPMLIPGPRLSGLDFSQLNRMVGADANGSLLYHWNLDDDTVSASRLPRGYTIKTLTAR